MKDVIVPVSGGKDSQAVLALALDLYGRERVVALHNYTGFDHSFTYEHLKYMEGRYNLPIEIVKSATYDNIFDVIRGEGYFPNGKARVCTRELKLKPFRDWLNTNGFDKVPALVLYGMRAAESSNRKAKYGHLSPDDVYALSDMNPLEYAAFTHINVQLPIVTWSTKATFEFLLNRGDKVNRLYTEKNEDRVGCFPCVLSSQNAWERAIKDPEGRRNVEKLVEIQDEFERSPTGYKLFKIHNTRDIKALLRTGRMDGRGTLGFDDDSASGCSFCEDVGGLPK